MRQLSLLAVVISLAVPSRILAQGAAVPSAAGTLMQGLRSEAGKNPAALPAVEKAHAGASRSFDGLGLTIKTLTPSRIVDINGSSFNGAVKEERKLRKEAPEIDPEAGEVPSPENETPRNERSHKYHFAGKVSGIPTLTIYTAKKDQPGQDNATEKPQGGGWRKWLPQALLFGGIAAAIAGVFFPPLLFLGGLLLGGYGMWKMMGAED